MFHLINRILAPRKYRADTLYHKIVAQARNKKFFSDYGVPDSPDGRFDSLSLHVILVLYTLAQLSNDKVADDKVADDKGQGKKNRHLGKELIEVMIEDLDHNFRELGVGDLSVGKKIKGMLKGFYGRMQSYEQAFEQSDEVMLKETLNRNLYRKTTATEENLNQMNAYIWQALKNLQQHSSAEISVGDIKF